MAAWLLVLVLRRWCTRWPEVRLDLMEFSSADRMIEHLMADGTDLFVGPSRRLRRRASRCWDARK
ncbi:hypothetical protein ACWCQS_07125 [Streptomyces sp. NPDC002076]